MDSKINELRRKQLSYLAFNFFSTIAVIFINKICFSKVQFVYPAALANIHFVITWIGITVMRYLNMFKPIDKLPSIRDKQFAAIVFFVGTVTPLNNTSLYLNSMVFYQVFKLLVTPMVVLLEYVLDGKTLSRLRAIFLIVVFLSVLISTAGDTRFSVYGTICASIWVPLAAGYKVQWGRVLKQYNCSTPALMHAVLPFAIIVQVICGIFVDPAGVLNFQWTGEALFWITLSGFAAFLVNLSGFLVMGGVGALAHVLLGQLKSSVICLGAYYLLNTSYETTQLIGASGAVLGIVAYTHAATNENLKHVKSMISVDKV